MLENKNSCVLIEICFNLRFDERKKFIEIQGVVTYGIGARVETLGPNWAQNTPTHFVLDLHGY